MNEKYQLHIFCVTKEAWSEHTFVLSIYSYPVYSVLISSLTAPERDDPYNFRNR